MCTRWIITVSLRDCGLRCIYVATGVCAVGLSSVRCGHGDYGIGIVPKEDGSPGISIVAIWGFPHRGLVVDRPLRSHRLSRVDAELGQPWICGLGVALCQLGLLGLAQRLQSVGRNLFSLGNGTHRGISVCRLLSVIWLLAVPANLLAPWSLYVCIWLRASRGGIVSAQHRPPRVAGVRRGFGKVWLLVLVVSDGRCTIGLVIVA
mmetsp:Transcript_89324/g.277765  ORF Transcript_89324/g.277765 Transcript_89324/m.277765 type:complete len:205 (+) Transcript_89324:1799-2413(+)